ncbi:ribosome maturation factor RimP [Isoptericola cucumis]|uniref:Ribosome maturation factor RimP n=1 Tax=Isoptericola cucumis TaxID=1776856 RepID=A0ABQ2B7X5_9MICO|nr:ribosome maturation factor RimP [Isoptericola cucumis]GGI07769.1 ribosome maturation factor RimP [Isoptericola cucumis]
MAAQHGRTTTDSVATAVAPVVAGAGLFLEGVVLTRAGSKSVVRVTVDLPEDAVGSVDSDTLGDVSRALSAALDEQDVVAGAYTLEVSTPGTSRALTELRHFKRARTRLVTLRLHDGGTVEGRLVDVVDEAPGPQLVLEDGTRVAVDDVRKGKVEVELKRPDAADTDDASDGPAEDHPEDGAGDDPAGTHDTTGSARHKEA